jgi:hypothetical protein
MDISALTVIDMEDIWISIAGLRGGDLRVVDGRLWWG